MHIVRTHTNVNTLQRVETSNSKSASILVSERRQTDTQHIHKERKDPTHTIHITHDDSLAEERRDKNGLLADAVRDGAVDETTSQVEVRVDHNNIRKKSPSIGQTAAE